MARDRTVNSDSRQYGNRPVEEFSQLSFSVDNDPSVYRNSGRTNETNNPPLRIEFRTTAFEPEEPTPVERSFLDMATAALSSGIVGPIKRAAGSLSPSRSPSPMTSPRAHVQTLPPLLSSPEPHFQFDDDILIPETDNLVELVGELPKGLTNSTKDTLNKLSAVVSNLGKNVTELQEAMQDFDSMQSAKVSWSDFMKRLADLPSTLDVENVGKSLQYLSESIEGRIRGVEETMAARENPLSFSQQDMNSILNRVQILEGQTLNQRQPVEYERLIDSKVQSCISSLKEELRAEIKKEMTQEFKIAKYLLIPRGQ